MKKPIKTILVTVLSIFAFSSGFAAMMNDNTKMNEKKMMHMKWMCTTNASSSSATMDQKADDEMKNKMKSPQEAFMFAYKHCRDCNKISCSMENH